MEGWGACRWFSLRVEKLKREPGEEEEDGGGSGRSLGASEKCLQAERTAHSVCAGRGHWLPVGLLPQRQAALRAGQLVPLLPPPAPNINALPCWPPSVLSPPSLSAPGSFLCDKIRSSLPSISLFNSTPCHNHQHLQKHAKRKTVTAFYWETIRLLGLAISTAHLTPTLNQT